MQETKSYEIVPRTLESLEDFVWGYHHRAYIVHCADNSPRSLHERKDACGYRNVNKFIKREGDWVGCLRPIPLTYLQIIGCDLETLSAAVRQDQEEYEQALQFTLHPRKYVIRLMGAMYAPRTLPENCTLEQAEAEIAAFQAEHPNIRCCMSWAGVRTLFYKNGVLHSEMTYRPEYTVTKEGVSFGLTGMGEGVMHFKC